METCFWTFWARSGRFNIIVLTNLVDGWTTHWKKKGCSSNWIVSAGNRGRTLRLFETEPWSSEIFLPFRFQNKTPETPGLSCFLVSKKNSSLYMRYFDSTIKMELHVVNGKKMELQSKMNSTSKMTLQNILIKGHSGWIWTDLGPLESIFTYRYQDWSI